MKAIRLFFFGGLVLLLFSGCQGIETLGGQKVRFSASSAQTKAEYASIESGVINWTDGDQILIWSDNAVHAYRTDEHFAVYDIIPDSNPHTGKLANPASDPNGLVFVDGVVDYTFWAAYPADALSATPTGSGAAYAIPQNQGPAGSASTSGTATTLPADMTQAFMFATATRSSGSANQVINLQFVPGFTTFVIQLTAESEGASIPVEKLEVSGLAGSVAYDFSSFSATPGKLTYTFPSGTILEKGKTLTFTLFALPTDIVNPQFVFTLVGGDTRTVSFENGSGGAITFEACKKHLLYGLAMPDRIRFYASLADMQYASRVLIVFE